MYCMYDVSSMRKSAASPPRMVREPVQAYFAADDSALLSFLATDTGLSKAEVLRRGVRSFAREHGGVSPMLRFIAETGAGAWPANVAATHDDVLADAYRAPHKKKPR